MNHSNNVVSAQPKAIADLSLALEKIIQETTTMQPQTISIFFDGTEVYRQCTEDGSVFWGETEDNSAQSTIDPIALFTSH